MAIALHYRQRQGICGFGGRLILDWLVLVAAFVATSLRLQAFRTDLDTAGADGEQEPLTTSRSGLVDLPANFQVGEAEDTHV